MKPNFKIYKTEYGYDIEVSGGFSFNDLTYETMVQLSVFLSNLGYEEFWGTVL